jgi:hypothetical protein
MTEVRDQKSAVRNQKIEINRRKRKRGQATFPIETPVVRARRLLDLAAGNTHSRTTQLNVPAVPSSPRVRLLLPDNLRGEPINKPGGEVWGRA